MNINKISGIKFSAGVYPNYTINEFKKADDSLKLNILYDKLLQLEKNQKAIVNNQYTTRINKYMGGGALLQDNFCFLDGMRKD